MLINGDYVAYRCLGTSAPTQEHTYNTTLLVSYKKKNIVKFKNTHVLITPIKIKQKSFFI